MANARKAVLILFILSAFIGPVNAQPQDSPLSQDSTADLDASTAGSDIAVPEASPKPVTIEEGLARKISLDLRGIELEEVFKFLAKKGNLNIVTSKGVSGRVTLLLNDVSILDIIDVILLTNKLAYHEDRGIITIMSEAEYEAIYGEQYNDKREIKTVKLVYSDPKKMGTILSNLKSNIGKIVIDEETASIILIDLPEKIKEMEDACKEFDISTVSRIIPTVTEVIQLNHAKAEDIKAEIKEALTPTIGVLRTDARTNRFVITDLPHNMEKVKDLIKAFDDKTKEVFIESKIVEVTVSDDFFMGVDWKTIFRKVSDLTLDQSLPSTISGSAKGSITYGVLADDDLEIALDFLKTVGRTRIVSSPHIAVCNNEEAKFMVGSREAYVTTTTTTGDVTTTTSENVQFIDVGVNLYVTPVISSSGFVKMRIKPEISSVREWLTTSEGNKIPIIDTSNVETEVMVKDGKTMIIAGLIKETGVVAKSRIPILGDIPIAGALFGTSSSEKERKELIIFLTPHIISGGDDFLYRPESDKKRKPLKE